MEEQQSAGFWLSPQQRLVWKLTQEAVRPCCLLSLRGAVDAERVRGALEEIASRHEILRTVFRRPAGMRLPFQVILDQVEARWEQTDISALSPSQREESIQELWDKARSSDRADQPGFKAIFIKLAEDSFSLIISLNPLCADAQSLQILACELGLLYAGAKSELPEPFRYVQFAQWQADLLQSSDEDAQRAKVFWSKQMKTANALALPTESRVHEGRTFDPQVITAELTQAFADGVIRQHPAMFLLATWECLLSRLSGNKSFVVGYLADSREYEELENAVGCIARTLPIPVRIESDFCFSDVLRQTSKALPDSIAMQEYCPLEANASDGESVSFAYQQFNPEQVYGGVTFSLERLYAVDEHFKLRLTARQRGMDLVLEFHYDAARLTRAAVKRIASYYENLLRAALAQPDAAVSDLPLLPELERRQLLIDWNDTAAEYPGEQCVHQLFEQQAARTPERIAVRSGEQTVTYRELNERANQLAHRLRHLGVGPDGLVGLCVERSAEVMVAVLATLKAGGAYVPLNAEHPKPRLRQQLNQVRVLITEQKLQANMPEFAGLTLRLDTDQSLWAGESRNNPAVITTPENLVYVIYTSGSTGTPKGVGVRHRNLVNYTHFICRWLKLEQYPEGLQFASVSTLAADLGNTVIYPALVSGGCLHVIPFQVSTDAEQFAVYSREYGLEVLKIVPSHLEALLHGTEARQVLPTKYLITGGETLTRKLVEKIVALSGSCRLLNHYGPTETTVGSLTLDLNEYDWRNSAAASVPIGRPIANTQIYILDNRGEPVPIGVVGELYIGGTGVTAGYLNQPERTAESFVPDRFAGKPDSKLYRTGDLARYWPDGNVEFLGRADDQVKIRGFRIELGEIEVLLSQHPAVKQAVVVAREDERGEKRLVAYVVSKRELPVTREQLQEYLEEQLPDYMVPSGLVMLPKVPLTDNGKIDRQALPVPEQVQSKAYVAPCTPTEEIVANIWGEVFGRDKISAEDSFFEIGGHSLMATQVLSRVRERFRIEIAISALFEKPTIRELAEVVDIASQNGNQDEHDGIVAVRREAYRAAGLQRN